MKTVNFIFLKFIVRKYYFFGAETCTSTKKEDSKIQAMEIKFFRAILNKAKNENIKNSNIK